MGSVTGANIEIVRLFAGLLYGRIGVDAPLLRSRDKSCRYKPQLVKQQIAPPAHRLKVGKLDTRQADTEKDYSAQDIGGQIANFDVLGNGTEDVERNTDGNDQHKELSDSEIPDLKRLIENNDSMDSGQSRKPASADLLYYLHRQLKPY